MPRPLIGDEGMDYIALTCSRAGAFFLPRPRQDVGVDGHIEFLDEQNHPTGTIILIQCKAGPSYISDSGTYQIRAKKHNFQTWSKYRIPVIGVVYNPLSGDARWVNISAYLKAHPTVIEHGPYVIDTPDDALFTEEMFAAFQKTMEATSAHSESAQELIERYLTGDEITREVALTELFAEYRWIPLTCFFLYQVLRIENDPSLFAYLIDMTGYYLAPHRGYNLPSENVSKGLEVQAKGYVRDFDIPIIIKILFSLVDGKGLDQFDRSHIVEIQLEVVNDIEEKLCSIIRNQKLTSVVRSAAIDLLVLSLNYFGRDFYEDVLREETDPLVIEALHFALETSSH